MRVGRSIFVIVLILGLIFPVGVVGRRFEGCWDLGREFCRARCLNYGWRLWDFRRRSRDGVSTLDTGTSVAGTGWGSLLSAEHDVSIAAATEAATAKLIKGVSGLVRIEFLRCLVTRSTMCVGPSDVPLHAGKRRDC